MRRVFISGVLFIPALFFLACGGDNDDDAPSSASTPAAAATTTGEPADGSDACSLLTNEEVSEALGADVSEAEQPAEAPFACRYIAPRGQGLAVVTILVMNSGTASGARSAFESEMGGVQGVESVTSIGDEAFYVADQLHVLGNGAYFIVGGDVTLEAAKSLAQKALDRLN